MRRGQKLSRAYFVLHKYFVSLRVFRGVVRVLCTLFGVFFCRLRCFFRFFVFVFETRVKQQSSGVETGTGSRGIRFIDSNTDDSFCRSCSFFSTVTIKQPSSGVCGGTECTPGAYELQAQSPRFHHSIVLFCFICKTTRQCPI